MVRHLPPELDPFTEPLHTSLRLPGTQDIVLTQRLAAVIDHPAFQRLRRVRQLGPTHWVYPGAVHSRFEHSLGVYATVQSYLNSLRRNPDFANLVTAEDLLTVLAAGLLHDVGHYPYAHSLEAVHHKDDALDTPRHEDLGMGIIAGESFECIPDNIRFNEDGKTIADLLESDWHVNPERIVGLCTGDFVEPTSPVDSILRSIISSAIDADKMDYLWRDSLHTGVPYGQNFDKQRLLNAITLDDSGTRIAINAKGKVCAEGFIFARYLMFSELYWHHKNRAASAMVEAAVRELRLGTSADGGGDDATGDDAKGGTRGLKGLFPTILNTDDDQFLEWLAAQFVPKTPGWFLTQGLVGNRRQLYKRVATYSMVYQEPEKLEAYRKLFYATSSEIDDVVRRMSDSLSRASGCELSPGMLIIDIPPRDKDALETVEVVYQNAYGRSRYPLHELSRIVAGIQSDFVTVVKKIRVFVHPAAVGSVRCVANLEDLLLKEIL